MTFIVVSILRSGLIATERALAPILGGGVGVSALAVIVTFTFDIKVAALYMLGIAGACVVSEQLSRYRPLARRFSGGP